MKIPRILILSAIMLAGSLPGVLFGQDSKLVDAAKKEGGRVVIYGSIENDTMDLVAAALKKKRGWRQSIGALRRTKLQTGS